MPIEHGMNRARGGDADIAGQSSDQQLADLAGAPIRLVFLESYNRILDLLGELVGIAHRAPRAIGERLEPVLLVTIENFVAGLSGYPERPADLRHPFTIQKTGHKTKSFFHYRTLFPRHQHLPQKRKVLPMCPVQNVTYVSGRSNLPSTARYCRRSP